MASGTNRIHPRVRRIVGRTALTAAAVALWPLLAGAQTGDQRVYATVLDADGEPVDTLSRTDIAVREDGVSREVLRVTPALEPLQLAVLVDNSEASTPFLSDLRAGLQAFFEEMGDGHEMALVGFGERPTVLVDYTREASTLVEGAGRLFAQVQSGAYLMDAVVEVSQGLQTRAPGRRAIVVIATEGPEYSNRYHQGVIDVVRDTGATLHAITLGVPRYDGSDRERERSYALDRGTVQTGGHQTDLRTSSTLPSAMRALARELTGQYEIVYARPGSLIPPETIEVAATRADLRVRATQLLPRP